jgi:hypothetical protein
MSETNRALFCTEKDASLGKALGFLKDPKFVKSMFQIRGGYDQRKKALSQVLTVFLPNNTGVRWLMYLGLFQFSGAKINEKFYLEPHDVWKLNWPEPHTRTAKSDDDGYVAGPKRVSPYVYNGNDWLQIWAFTPVAAPESKLAEKLVSMPSRIFSATPGAKARARAREGGGTHMFLSQAEFYFDCDSVWQSSGCNSNAAATYQMRWKARLRRVHHPDVLVDLFELFLDNGLASTVFKRFTESKLDSLAKFLNKESKFKSGAQTAIEALRNDITKYGNGKLDSDTSSDVYLH